MTQFLPTGIPDVIEIRPRRFDDDRGYFAEVFSRDAFAAAGLDQDWVQDNQSLSAAVGTLRGLHFQRAPRAQAKLVRVLAGAIYDVAVDLRAGSPTYARWVGVELSAAAFNQLFVPRGFAHGFMTLELDTQVLYKVDAPYAREAEGAIAWDDPDLAIDWPDVGIVTLSEKDRTASSLASLGASFDLKDA